MPTLPSPRPRAALGADEDFIELVCSDEELLRAEFEAIVSEEWSSSSPPPDPPIASQGARPQRRESRVPHAGRARPRRPAHPGADAWGRQRSPPR